MVSRSQARRRGFTLIELLVVVAIIAVLMALLLPAVQKVREAANKITCGKNLNQIAMGCHMFHHDFNRFPTGGWSGQALATVGTPGAQTANSTAARSSGQYQSAGWAFQILSYIEQKQIYDAPLNSTTVMTNAQIPIYFCPSRRAPTVVGTRGLNDYAATYPQAAFSTLSTGANAAGLIVPPVTANSAIGDNRVQLTQGSIPTGSSNVIMISEKWINQNNYAGNTPGDTNGYMMGWPNSTTANHDSVRLATLQPRQDSEVTIANTTQCIGSAHPSTFQVVMGDRTVKQIRYSIASGVAPTTAVATTTLAALCNRKNVGIIDWSQIE